MKALPEGLDEQDLVAELAAGWGIAAATVEYAPLGFGSYHWIVVDTHGRRFFATVDDLGRDASTNARVERYTELLDAFETAIELREEADLAFVLAPIPTNRTSAVGRLGSRYSIALFPFVDGESKPSGAVVSDDTAAAVIRILAELHQVRGPAIDLAATHDIAVPGRSDIEAALGDLEEPWTRGPYAERAREWVAKSAATLVTKLETFDDLVARVDATPNQVVITHGEPHPGNFIRTDTGLMLIDWDTVALARPERDLWLIAGKSGAELDLYAELTGHRANPDALALYRLRWDLADIAIYLDRFRSDHTENEDTEESFRELTSYLEFGPAV